jgi:hypothetical protein
MIIIIPIRILLLLLSTAVFRVHGAAGGIDLPRHHRHPRVLQNSMTIKNSADRIGTPHCCAVLHDTVTAAES